MKAKIFVMLVITTLLVGIMSGCTEEKKETETPTNNAPEASFTASIDDTDTSIAGGTVTFDATATDQDADDTLTYAWDFGDGETSTDEDPVHVYADNGTYTVILTVSDSEDEVTASDTVIVGNVAPTASFTYEADDLNVTFTSTSTDPNLDDVLTYEWTIDDVAVNTSSEFTYEFADYGTYNVTLTVTDLWGLTDTSDVTEITLEAV